MGYLIINESLTRPTHRKLSTIIVVIMGLIIKNWNDSRILYVTYICNLGIEEYTVPIKRGQLLLYIKEVMQWDLLKI